MSFLTFAFCTYNRADRLETLVREIARQESSVPFEILVVNNNSSDNTLEILEKLSAEVSVPFRYVTETNKGIVPARNRAIEESLESDYLIFMDDDELPHPGMIAAAIDGLDNEGADCVGGRVKVNFEPFQRPAWLGDELLGFLAEVNYGTEPFWITDRSTPVWTANVAYRTALFRDGLRFDARYNREGRDLGGGEDVIMFNTLLEQGMRIRYRADMVVDHFVDQWRLCRSYFLKLHFVSGRKFGRFELLDMYPRSVCGVPPFMIGQAGHHLIKTTSMALQRQPGVLRQAMNTTHSLGMIVGRSQLWKESSDER